jgi:hypothetical protein
MEPNPRHLDDIPVEEREPLKKDIDRALVAAIEIIAKKHNVCVGCMAKAFVMVALSSTSAQVEIVDLDDLAAAAAVKH